MDVLQDVLGTTGIVRKGVWRKKKKTQTNQKKPPPDSKSRQKIAKIGRSDACPIASREQRGSLVNE